MLPRCWRRDFSLVGIFLRKYSIYLVNNRFCGADGIISKGHALSVAGTQFKPHCGFNFCPLLCMANNRGAPPSIVCYNITSCSIEHYIFLQSLYSFSIDYIAKMCFLMCPDLERYNRPRTPRQHELDIDQPLVPNSQDLKQPNTSTAA